MNTPVLVLLCALCALFTGPAQSFAQDFVPLDDPLVELADEIAPAAPEAAPAEIGQMRIGLMLPLTGKRKKLGQAMLDAANFARVELGLPEFVVADTRGTPEGALQQVDVLSQDPRVALILGPVGWQASRAAAWRAQRAGIPMIVLSAEEGVEGIGRFVLRHRSSVQEQARRVAQVAVEEMQLERLAIMFPEDELGQAAAYAFFEQVRTLGARVTAFASYKPGDTNLTHGVEELVGKRGPMLGKKNTNRPPRSTRRKMSKVPELSFDGLFVPDYDEGAALASKFLRFHDVNLGGAGEGNAVQVLGIGTLPGPRLVDAEGLLAGALYTELFHPEIMGDRSRAFAARFEESFDRPPSDLEAEIQDVLAIGSRCLSQAHQKGLGTAKARQALPGLLEHMEPYAGYTGLRWFLSGGRPGRTLEVWSVDSVGAVSPSF